MSNWASRISGVGMIVSLPHLWRHVERELKERPRGLRDRLRRASVHSLTTRGHF